MEERERTINPSRRKIHVPATREDTPAAHEARNKLRGEARADEEELLAACRCRRETFARAPASPASANCALFRIIRNSRECRALAQGVQSNNLFPYSTTRATLYPLRNPFISFRELFRFFFFPPVYICSSLLTERERCSALSRSLISAGFSRSVGESIITRRDVNEEACCERVQPAKIRSREAGVNSLLIFARLFFDERNGI